MSEHRATVSWERGSVPFSYETYVRDHAWRFPGGTQIAASAAPEFKGNPDLVDPEGALVAALSSCHMLTFLAVAARKRLVVDSYVDEAMGFLEKNDAGKLAITRVVLRPKISFGEGKAPTAEELEKLHHIAHDQCFIANSVKTVVSVEPE